MSVLSGGEVCVRPRGSIESDPRRVCGPPRCVCWDNVCELKNTSHPGVLAVCDAFTQVRGGGGSRLII